MLANAWPAIDDARGRFLFVLDETGAKRDRYVAGHPSLAGRVLFVNAPPERDEAAFLIMNEPIADGARIRELVAQGFLVRTRADADTREARSGETARREAAFASGAQVVSTDYYEPNPAFGTGYEVDLPGGGVARCNPARIAAPTAASTSSATERWIVNRERLAVRSQLTIARVQPIAHRAADQRRAVASHVSPGWHHRTRRISLRFRQCW